MKKSTNKSEHKGKPRSGMSFAQTDISDLKRHSQQAGNVDVLLSNATLKIKLKDDK